MIQHQILITTTRIIMDPGEENLYFHTTTSSAIVSHIHSTQLLFTNTIQKTKGSYRSVLKIRVVGLMKISPKVNLGNVWESQKRILTLIMV